MDIKIRASVDRSSKGYMAGGTVELAQRDVVDGRMLSYMEAVALTQTKTLIAKLEEAFQREA